MHKNDAKEKLSAAGYDVLEQRGFYSHFLRVRSVDDRRTVTTIDIEDDEIPAGSLTVLLSITSAAIDENKLSRYLQKLMGELPETISLDDLQRHPWLRRLVLACDDMTNRAEYTAIDWAKTQGYPE